MLDQQRQDEINAAVWRAYDVLRGVADLGDSVNFLLAMLLLKYVSDISQDGSNLNDDRSVGTQLVVPKEADFRALHASWHELDNGTPIDVAIRAIEEVDCGLRGVSQGIGFDSNVLRNLERNDRSRVLRLLLDAFNTGALDFRTDCENAAQAVAYASDSILRCAAEGSGKRGGEFSISPDMAQLIGRLMQPKAGETVSDPFCGSASLLIACGQQAGRQSGHSGCALYGQEKNGRTWTLAKMNLFLHGETDYRIEWGDTLRDPKLLAADHRLMKFDIVVSSPPFSVRDWGHDVAERDVYQRFWRGIPPRTVGDYAFISHMVETLRPETGRMAVVVPLGVLFRGAVERQIREQFIHENLIDAVIALPTKMLSYTAIPVAVLVLRKKKADDSVLFINASQFYQPGKIQNILRQEDLELIEETYRARREVPQYARLVSREEITANDCNLSVTRYVDATEEEAQIDLAALRAERASLRAELSSLEAKLAHLLQEIGHA